MRSVVSSCGLFILVLLSASAIAQASPEPDLCFRCVCKTVLTKVPCCSVEPAATGPRDGATASGSPTSAACFADSSSASAQCGQVCQPEPSPPACTNPPPCESGEMEVFVSKEEVIGAVAASPDCDDCPETEEGACRDGVNNDGLEDDLTDCFDPDCASDPFCMKMAPAASPLGIVGLGIALAGLGALVLRRTI